MGILNMTPDSFSDGGQFADPAAALEHALAMVGEGAAIIDVGGESTRPGSDPVDPEEEWARIGEVIASLAERELCVSVDTRHAEVAARALAAMPELAATVPEEEYERLLDFADGLGVEDYFWQEGGAAEESFIPAFDFTGV